LVAVAVAVASGDVRTSALVDLTWAVAHAASVELANAVVDIVTGAIGIGVCCAVTTTHAQGVELVAVAVSVSFRDVRTSALVNGAWTVAHAASVERANAVVHVVTDAIGISVCCAVTATHTQGVELVAVAVTVSFRDVRASALVDLAWAVAHATSVKCSNAVVHIVTDAIGIGVCCAVTTTHAQGVELVAVAVAVACRDVRTSALVDLTWAVAHAASVEFANAVVHVIADAIHVGIHARTPAYAALVSVLARTVIGISTHVVVACHLVRTAEHFVLARAVVVLCSLVVVRSCAVGTAASNAGPEGACALKNNLLLNLICPHAEREDLVVDLP
jgi:hypothetical protein